MSENSTKVTATHLRRDAYLYVRQSTLYQVANNTESGRRQYDLRGRAVALGWPAERVIVIDVDQGQSGASSADREGFKRLVAEVSLGKAGIVLGLECSRLARNNADWHRLLQLCAFNTTLILDEDGLYDPCSFNDRMLLGMKGQLSEAELHLIGARLRGGILAKAARGELALQLPVGLVYDAAGNVTLDPDTGVRRAVSHLFTTFTTTGSARAVIKTFTAEDLTFPMRHRGGPRSGELYWTPLTHDRVLKVLHNPRYAGAYCYGRSRHYQDADGHHHSVAKPREEWTTLIPEAHPGYITFEQYEANLAILTANAAAHGTDRKAGPPREGPALLQGLVVCGKCGRRMSVRYHSRTNGTTVPDYVCQATGISKGIPICQYMPGANIDTQVATLILDTLTPLALEVALTVTDELTARAEEADTIRATHVERARHTADLARRRYLAVDPTNRLVADTLEADWNQKLRELTNAQDDYDKASSTNKNGLNDTQRERIRALAANFPALWNNPATPIRERKRLIRLLITDVTLIKTSDGITAHVRLRGGQHVRNGATAGLRRISPPAHGGISAPERIPPSLARGSALAGIGCAPMTAVSTSPVHAGLARVLADITAERESQHILWGVQHHMPDGTGPQWTSRADAARRECERASETGRLSWRHVLVEEVAEALAEDEPTRLRRELVQVAAVAVQWIQALDHRNPPAAEEG